MSELSEDDNDMPSLPSLSEFSEDNDGEVHEVITDGRLVLQAAAAIKVLVNACLAKYWADKVPVYKLPGVNLQKLQSRTKNAPKDKEQSVFNWTLTCVRGYTGVYKHYVQPRRHKLEGMSVVFNKHQLVSATYYENEDTIKHYALHLRVNWPTLECLTGAYPTTIINASTQSISENSGRDDAKAIKRSKTFRRWDAEDEIQDSDPDVLESLTVAMKFHRMVKGHIAATGEAQDAGVHGFVHGLVENTLVISHVNQIAVTEQRVLYLKGCYEITKSPDPFRLSQDPETGKEMAHEIGAYIHDAFAKF
ncbi:hypothetical protein DEU56DRAFT_755523 [Suillus clintonianus]|uniref:uncharacterized protein n=1 Tax=Suillus clintonianus TaxID=1904413 RepID=UPI001B87AF8D|nr:uncharacterized protein DEU56DRAFT_755523 [Suillus clintonianus]KAG2139775.1 hypothetical protein DEU56DRAFT_755523 [Suillus clintonianus]